MSGPTADEDIQREVLASLRWDSRVDAGDIEVSVEDGVVTLDGSVPTYRTRRAARETAQLVRGVERVDNHLDVEVSASLETPGDGELREALTDVLRADPDLVDADLHVGVQGGRVRLSGTVTTFWQKELAAATAAASPGVRGIANELAVVPGGDQDDEAVAQDVIAALRRNRNVDPSHLDVEVSGGGRVLLAGQIPDEDVRRQIVDTARHTAGVTEITDQLRTTPDGGRGGSSGAAS